MRVGSEISDQIWEALSSGGSFCDKDLARLDQVLLFTRNRAIKMAENFYILSYEDPYHEFLAY